MKSGKIQTQSNWGWFGQVPMDTGFVAMPRNDGENEGYWELVVNRRAVGDRGRGGSRFSVDGLELYDLTVKLIFQSAPLKSLVTNNLVI